MLTLKEKRQAISYYIAHEFYNELKDLDDIQSFNDWLCENENTAIYDVAYTTDLSPEGDEFEIQITIEPEIDTMAIYKDGRLIHVYDLSDDFYKTELSFDNLLHYFYILKA